MIINSIRLKNIKSYGEGDDGRGITVEFREGVNRIAGLNGNGKTTLIECVGYAFFLSEPFFQANFEIDTYLLRSGEKIGEIDVCFSIDKETYRIERGVGVQSKRRTKVVRTADESISAEGDKEVAEFLCRLLGIPSRERLAELFRKLIGVKQGRLTLPFDSAAGAAKKFFEPLLEVEVFRQCFDHLKPAVDAFKEQIQDQELKQSGIRQKIEDRKDSAVSLENVRKSVEKNTADLIVKKKTCTAAFVKKQELERLEKAASDALSAEKNATIELNAAKERAFDAANRVKEAEEASKFLSLSEPGHNRYVAAEDTLKKLGVERKAREKLREDFQIIDNNRKSCEASAASAENQKEIFENQVATEVAESEKTGAAIISLKNNLADRKEGFDKLQDQAGNAAANGATIKSWIDSLPDAVIRLGKTTKSLAKLDKELSSWDLLKIDSARKSVEAQKEAHEKTKKELAEAEERKKTLIEQIDKIGSGVCPFLNETCRQFDPAKVQGDLAGLDLKIAVLKKHADKAVKELDAAEKILKPLVIEEGLLPDRQKQHAAFIQNYREELHGLVSTKIETGVQALLNLEPAAGASPDKPFFERDLSAALIDDLQKQVERFSTEADAWWKAAKPLIDARVKNADSAKTARTQEESILASKENNLEKLLKTIAGIRKKAEAKASETARYAAEAAEFIKKAEELNCKLKQYDGLDDRIKTQEDLKEANEQSYKLFLESKKLAGELESRTTAHATALFVEKEKDTAYSEKRCVLLAAQTAFSASDLDAAKKDHEEKLKAEASAVKELDHVKEEQVRQETRFKEWEDACREEAVIQNEIDRLAAAIELTELARNTLKNSAPSVAQHLCNRISARAQSLFNKINPDPIDLEWKAENYTLRITPGNRYFAMLSGGEQTKLGLAMTLAMVEEFSRLQFCVFDEPTYGVDAESRRKLADAILEAQKAAGLEQLFLVSHDDAFEGKIEHSILLKKSAAKGTSVDIGSF